MIPEWVSCPSPVHHPTVHANCTLAQGSSVWDDSSASTPIPEGCWGRDFSGPICTLNGECQLQHDCQDDTKPRSSQQPVFNKQGPKEDDLQVVVLCWII